MSALYLHIPFCRRACYYCDFHFSTSQQTRQDVLRAMLQELIMRSHEITSPIQSIYLGGGTPSLLEYNELMMIFDQIFLLQNVLQDAEITIEVNPDDLNRDKLKQVRNSPVNRFSIGVQSFHDDDLKYMHRIHSARDAEYAIKGAQDNGFDNISVDLIYGIPTLTHEGWINNIQKLISFDVPHISAYALTVEQHTPLFHLIKRKKLNAPLDASIIRQFNNIAQILPSAGYEHYEISNFAKTGFRSRHNSSYWQGKAYVGIGPSAHSFDGKNTRRWNVSNNIRYIKGLQGESEWFETEYLSKENKLLEWVMTSLRCAEGIRRESADKFGPGQFDKFINNATQMSSHWFNADADVLRLTPSGMLMCDYITLQLLN
ncbi:MAG: radical SAM family heme chaperone HemW [Candidatus Competibacteraceae bacterium]|nr:radical SAM family heme chaperone HemW [Candidatus Competibacteraceae bacterium]